MHNQTERKAGDEPRINVRRIARNILLALVLPCVLAIFVDIVAGTWPFVTLVVAAFVFPIAGIIVLRSLMQELERVIQEVAPVEREESAVTGESISAQDA